MKLKEIMTGQVECVDPDSTITEAARKMDDINVGALPVCEGKKLVGIITDRDIVIRSISVGQDPNVTLVKDAMTASDLVTCNEEDNVTHAAQLMERKQIRRIPIVNQRGELVGIVAVADLAVKATDAVEADEVIERISEPAHPEKKAA